MSTIKLSIKNLKSISNFTIELPSLKGLYAISGENGVGKSTILSALARIVYQGALTNYFRNNGDTTTEVKYEYQGLVNTWVKNPNWRRSNSDQEIRFYGTFEASILFGSRYSDVHKSKIRKAFSVRESNLAPASDFVKRHLGRILRDSESFYDDLLIIRSKRLAENYGFDQQVYYFKRNNKLISQFFMSSGELLIIGLLHFISKAIDNRSGHMTLIIIDEIDTALHPAAQIKLVQFLHQISDQYDFCIYFSTHSIPILDSVRPEHLYHIQKSFSGGLEVVNPCYAAYASRNLYSMNVGFDFLILVEDELCKYVIEQILTTNNLNENRLIKVLPCGDWHNTVRFHKELKDSNMTGSCQIMSILDGDIQQEYNDRAGTKFNAYRKTFLPIKSVEKYLKENLIDSPNDDFGRRFGDNFYRQRSLQDIISDYLQNTNSDNNGKKFFMVLKACAVDQGYTEVLWKNQVCDFIYRYDDFTDLEQALRQFLD